MSNVVNKKLWEQSKNLAIRESKYDTWNARIAQRAVQIYKEKGGKYKSPKSNNSLVQWTNESWQYHPSDTNQTGRYLPKYVWKKLTPNQVRITNLNKKNAKTKRVPYEDFIKNKF